MKICETPRSYGGWIGRTACSYGDTSYSVGRYELNKTDGVRMRIDYAIDPTVPFGKYGKFYSVFVSRFDPAGRAVEYARIVLDGDTPKIGMGSFDFGNEDNKRELEGLLSGGARYDVAQVLRDVLQLNTEGRLEKLAQPL